MFVRYMLVHLALFFCAFSTAAHAQEISEQTETIELTVPVAIEEQVPDDALGRGTPRGSIAGFLNTTSEFQFEKAAEYLDLRNLPGDIRAIGGAELARQLNHVLSRSVWIDDYALSDEPLGAQGDGLPEFRDIFVVIPTPDGEVTLWMQRIPRGDDVYIWKVSNRSVAQIPALYTLYSYTAPVEAIRQFIPDRITFLGMEAFKWVIMLIVALLCWPVFYLLGNLLARAVSSSEKPSFPHVKQLFTGPVVLIAILLVSSALVRKLGLSAYAQQIMNAYTLITVAAVWLLVSLINVAKNIQQEKLLENDRPGAAKLLRPAATLLRIFVVLLGLLFWLHNIGINITTVLAGLGVGGLAMALALQKPIEDMMGALSIFTQATVRVGDLVRYGDSIGTVEDIGLRITRIRTLTNTIITIPNAKIAYSELENLSCREKIRYRPRLRLRYDTDPEQIRNICGRIAEALANNPTVYGDEVRARFTRFEEDAVVIDVHCYLRTTRFPEFLEYQEELNYRIMEIVRSEGARFALPGRSLYLEGDGANIPG